MFVSLNEITIETTKIYLLIPKSLKKWELTTKAF